MHYIPENNTRLNGKTDTYCKQLRVPFAILIKTLQNMFLIIFTKALFVIFNVTFNVKYLLKIIKKVRMIYRTSLTR